MTARRVLLILAGIVAAVPWAAVAWALLYT